MHILGKIIKTTIEIKDKLSGEVQPVQAQKDELKKLLKAARNTEFGKHYGFEKILSHDNYDEIFRKVVPLHDYKSIYNDWWFRILNGEKNVTWPGRPRYFALSSGTTGKDSKRIPVTDEMLDSIKEAGVKQVTCLANFDLPPHLFEKQILMLGSCTDLIENDFYKEGEISGISASNIPFWFKSRYKPGDEISKINDWDERVAEIARQAADWDIGALGGIPSWIELMLKKVISHHNIKNIHEIWPDLSVFTSGGVAFEPYQKSFEKLLDHPITVIDTYLASEGFLAFQTRPETNAMALVPDNGIYFEFVPFEEKYIDEEGAVKKGAPILSLEDVEEGQDYVLIISTVAGAWRYMIGDTVEFTDKSRCEIRITGRTKHFLNVVGSQLSVNKMNDAMQYLEQHFNASIPEFTVAAVKKEDDYIHRWYLGSDDLKTSEPVNVLLDNYLAEANKNYKVARSKALKGVETEVVPLELFYEWNELNKKKGGQVKMPRVMKEEEFREWEHFVKGALKTGPAEVRV